jgi:hypothetical protein
MVESVSCLIYEIEEGFTVLILGERSISNFLCSSFFLPYVDYSIFPQLLTVQTVKRGILPVLMSEIPTFLWAKLKSCVPICCTYVNSFIFNPLYEEII